MSVLADTSNQAIGQSSPAADSAVPAVLEGCWKNPAIRNHWMTSPPGESFFLTAPDGWLAGVLKQGTAAPGFFFLMFCGRSWVPPPTHVEALGWRVSEQAVLLLEASQLLVLLNSFRLTALEPALWQSTCFQSHMNMQSRKLI